MWSEMNEDVYDILKRLTVLEKIENERAAKLQAPVGKIRSPRASASKSSQTKGQAQPKPKAPGKQAMKRPAGKAASHVANRQPAAKWRDQGGESSTS